MFNETARLVKEKIDKLDLTDVVKKLSLPPEFGGYSWPKDSAEKVSLEYKAFLWQSYQRQQLEGEEYTTPPSTVVDIFWHMHILFTKKYHQDCSEIFGFYLHHDPSNSARNLLKRGFDVPTVVEITELPIADVEYIAKQLDAE